MHTSSSRQRALLLQTPPPLGICLPGVSGHNATPPGISVIFQLGQAPLGNIISAVAPYCFPVFRQHNKYHKILMLFSWRDLFPLKFQLYFNCCKNKFVLVLIKLYAIQSAGRATGRPSSLHERGRDSCLRAVLCYKRLFTKACMGCKRFFLKERRNVMFLNKIDVFYCLVVIFVLYPRLRPF